MQALLSRLKFQGSCVNCNSLLVHHITALLPDSSASFKGSASLPHSIVTVNSGEHLPKAEGEEERIRSEVDEERKNQSSDKTVKFKDEAEELKGGPEEEPQPAEDHHRNSHALSRSDSPFRSVLTSRGQPDVRVTVDESEDVDDEQEFQLSKLKNLLKEPRATIQDMIDMSLSKKKLVTSEKMLQKAFVEFYRGLNLLKSYRYCHFRVLGPLNLQPDSSFRGLLLFLVVPNDF